MSTPTPAPQPHGTDQPAADLPDWIRNFTTFPRLGEILDDAGETKPPSPAPPAPPR